MKTTFLLPEGPCPVIWEIFLSSSSCSFNKYEKLYSPPLQDSNYFRVLIPCYFIGTARGSIKQGLLVLPSALPSVLALYWKRIISFSKLWHGDRNPYEVVRDRAGFSGKMFLPQKLVKRTKNMAL